MKYLLDTDVVIDHFRGKNLLDFKFIKAGSISIITLAELFYGAYKSENSSKAIEILENNLATLKLAIENLEEEIVDEFGKIKAELEIKGASLDDFDLLIASVAIVNNLTLVTRNVKHFRRIKGLKLYGD